MLNMAAIMTGPICCHSNANLVLPVGSICVSKLDDLQARSREIPLRVTCISPGVVETEFFEVASFGNKETAKGRYSQLKCLQPHDIADAVVWCLTAPDHMDVNDILIRPTAQKN